MSSPTEKDIFLDAIEIDDEVERAEFVRRACGDDERLRQQLEQLLAAHEKSVAVVDGMSNPQEQLHQHVKRAAEAFGLSGSRFAAGFDVDHDRSGETIQRYRLMEKLGEGGFGQVYVARQEQPVRRDVAMKLLKRGMDTKEVLARFEAERQALALMNHPNIAQVFDAGASVDGQPYIVMELVRGVSITSFCRKKALPLRNRLALFSDVCKAVHHAHQKGVIHRDLKPSNVLVAMHDALPVVKVIDFGVAKALNEPLTNKTIYTRFAQLIGTPMYMSPEQAEMNAFDVDTRSDVYSLGVLLYELLTDLTPFDQTRMQTASFDEMRKMIREEEPPRPSVRLTTAQPHSAKTVSDAHGDRAEFASRLRGDLDWIVMKALEKDRLRRYDTAAEMSRDVERFLQGEPIVARPPSRWYRLQKFADRNRLVLVAGSLVLLSLMVGTVVSTWQAVRATRAHQETERLRQEAVDFAERLKAANILLVSARANADQGRIPQAYAEFTQATELSPDHFLTWSGRGSLQAELGAWKSAARDYAKAIELGTPADDPSWWGVPQLCLYAGETDAYELVCRSLEGKLDYSHDTGLITLASRAICLQPIARDRAETLANRLEKLLDRAVWPQSMRPPSGHRPPHPRNVGRGGPRGGLPRELIAYGASLAHYRAGNYDRADELMTSIDEGMHLFPSGKLLSLPLSALVAHRRGASAEADQLLAMATTEHESWTNDILESGSVPFPWFDGLEGHLLLMEASREIAGQDLDSYGFARIEATAAALLQRESRDERR